MPSLLVRIVSPHRAVDVSVPDDRPVAELIPAIAAVCDGGGAASGGPWTLVPQGGEALDEMTTLGASGILDGTVLQLRSLDSPEPADGRAPRRAAAAPAPAPPVPPAPALSSPAAAESAPAPAEALPPRTPSPARTEVPPPPPAPSPAPAHGVMAATIAPPAQPARSSSPPSERSRALLPEHHPLPSRLGRAVSEALSGRRSQPVSTAEETLDGKAPSPSSLTIARPGSAGDRFRRALRATDYGSQLDALIGAPRLRSCLTVAVMSPKGGVGKTTITTLLGTLLAMLRHDRVIAIDTNPDYGSLGRTLAPDHTIFVDDLLEVLDHPALTVTQLDASLARAHQGLLVLPAPTDPERMARLGEDAYHRVIQRLQGLAGIVVLDCGTGLQEPTARAALACADQIVLVSDAEPATASLVAEASTLLASARAPLTLVVNKSGTQGRLDIDRFASYVTRVHALVTIPSEPRAAAAIPTGEFDWKTAPRSWQLGIRELAAVLAADWARLGLTVEL